MEILKLAIADLQVPEYRQRKEFDAESIIELLNSIEAHGLLQPIVVRANPSSQDSIQYTLVAGERRLRAIRALGDLGGVYRFAGSEWATDSIPGVSLGSLDQLSAESAELEENIRRVDLSWQERAGATARLADIRRRQATAANAQQPTMADLAAEIRPEGQREWAETVTQQEIILAANLDKPEVAKATSQAEAWKALKRHEEAQRNIALARTVGATFTSAVHTLVKGDCLKWMAEQPSEQFDVILTDPPYGIDAADFGDAGGRLVHQTHEYEDAIEWVIKPPFSEFYRLAKPEAHLYACCDIDFFHEWKASAQAAGWYVHRTPLINFKRDGSRVPLPSQGPQRKYELILYAIKGWKPVTRIYPDVIETHGDPNLSHGAQKPVALFVDLLKRSVKAGDRILDPFMGTGTAVVAAHELKCACVGVEMNEQYYGIALKRLQELK
jgi:ParB/RepB/Spo0J family partition protein